MDGSLIGGTIAPASLASRSAYSCGVAPKAVRYTRKVVVAIVGGVLVVVGIILIPLPGPGSLVIIAGLALLATEFASARRALDKAKDSARRAMPGMRRPPDPAEEPAVD